MDLTERFLGYVKKDTQSDEQTGLTPSTPGQMEFAQQLRDELIAIGLREVELDSDGYLYATLPASAGCADIPVVGFIAHLDTSPDMSGKGVRPRIVRDYDGGDITLNAARGIILQSDRYPELLDHRGEDLIVTDGTTLLGADDKAGIAEIVTAMEYLIAHPDIRHGRIRIAFNPDEEIGLGAHKFDVAKFGCAWAYTMDGGEVGELEFENFNAAVARVTFRGVNVHPGYAKHKMINANRVAIQFATMLPRGETPEHTEGYEGFYHLTSISGTVEETVLTYIIRDHDRDRFERRKKELEHLARKVNNEFPDCVTLDIRDQYYNMREKVAPVMHIVDIAKAAMEEVGVAPRVQPIRGGTDGAQLSFRGLPCPNIFAGGLNFHGRYEFVPIASMEKAMMTVVKICEIVGRGQ